jgi:hypothetical protein
LTQFAQQVRERLGARWPRLLPNTGSRVRNASRQSGRPFQVPFWRAGSDGNGNGQRWNSSSGGGHEAARDRADERPTEASRSKD